MLFGGIHQAAHNYAQLGRQLSKRVLTVHNMNMNFIRLWLRLIHFGIIVCLAYAAEAGADQRKANIGAN